MKIYKITFESDNYPKRTIIINKYPKLRTLLWEVYNIQVDSIIKVNNNRYLADDITCIIEK